MIRCVSALAILASALMVPTLADAMQGPGTQAPQPSLPLVRAGAAAIDAPWTVDPGQSVDVSIAGAVPGGRLEIWGPVRQGNGGRMLAGAEVSGVSVPVTAPNLPGSYVLRYLGPHGEILARRDFEVAAVPVRLSVPEQFGTGVPGQIRWRGPARPGDMLRIVNPASGAVISEAPAEGVAGAENVTTLRGPAQAGEYQLQYVSRERGSVLRALPITVGPAHGWMRLPEEITAGRPFDVEWRGPAAPGQLFQIIDPARDSVIASARPRLDAAGVSVILRAPEKPGTYRIRLIDTQTGKTYSDHPLRID